MNVQEAAAILGIQQNAVRAACASGTLPAVKDGRVWVLKKEDVIARREAMPVNQKETCTRLRADKALMQRLYDEHGTFKRAAATVGISKVAFGEIFHSHGLKPRPKGHKYKGSKMEPGRKRITKRDVRNLVWKLYLERNVCPRDCPGREDCLTRERCIFYDDQGNLRLP